MFGKESVIPEILVERLGLSILNGILEGTSMTSSIFIRLCLHCYRVAFVIKEHELLFQRRTLCFLHRWRPSPHWSMMGARQLWGTQYAAGRPICIDTTESCVLLILTGVHGHAGYVVFIFPRAIAGPRHTLGSRVLLSGPSKLAHFDTVKLLRQI